MPHRVSIGSRQWSLARQLVVLQVSVVLVAVVIEAMVAVYRGPGSAGGWGQRDALGLVTLTEMALLVGIAGSLYVADRVEKQTFGMPPGEIAKRYQVFDAMLHAVREGLVITDADGLIVLANDEARKLLPLAGDCEGKPFRDQVPDTGWADAETPVTDRLYPVGERELMVSRSAATIDGMPVGLVTTVRDRTELRDALHALSEAVVSADELHKRAHDHANHLQTVIALIEERNFEEAIKACVAGDGRSPAVGEQSPGHLADLVLASRLPKLLEQARRGGVELRLVGTLGAVREDLRYDLADITGNLLKNAVEAAAQAGRGGWARLCLERGADGSIRVDVSDSGPGIAEEEKERIFEVGWTTKGGGHGYGLALTRDLVRRMRGEIRVSNTDGAGAVFGVRIPAPGAEGREESREREGMAS